MVGKCATVFGDSGAYVEADFPVMVSFPPHDTQYQFYGECIYGITGQNYVVIAYDAFSEIDFLH